MALNKNLLISLSVILFLNISVFSQNGWVWQNPLPQGNGEKDLQFVNSSTAFCISYNYVLKSTDAGNTWQLKWTNLSQNHISLSFVDENTGYLLCDTGLVLKTTNSGDSWTQIYNFNHPGFALIRFVNHSIGFILCEFFLNSSYNEIIYRTTDAGATWNTSAFDSSFSLIDLNFINQNTGFVCGNNLHSGFQRVKFLKTTNSGLSWDSTSQRINIRVNGIYYLNENTGFIYGQGIQTGSSIYITTDGGINWTGVISFYSIRVMQFINGIGYAFDGYTMFKSINGGITWNQIGNISIGIGYGEDEFCFISENYGLTAGSGIAKTTNGGTNWINISGSYNGYIWNMDFVNNYTGYAAGEYGLLKTTSAGQNWYLLPRDNGVYGDYCVEFVNAQTGYCSYFQKLIKTTNGGYNWDTLITGYNGYLNDIQFLNESTGYILYEYNKAFKTSNAGLNWELISNYIYGYQDCLNFINENTGFIGKRNWNETSAMICRTLNGGTSWDSIYIPGLYPRDFYFVNNNTGYSVIHGWQYSCIYKTTNTGINWFEIYYYAGSNINVLQFLNENTGYGSCDRGKVIRTTNAGQTWKIYNSISLASFSDMHFFDANNGIFAGSGSIILKTTNGCGEPIGIEPVNNTIPESFILYQNYPNPFNPTTKIRFKIPLFRGVDDAAGGRRGVLLKIYDILGKEAAILVNEPLAPGTYEVEFDGSNFASGIYFYSLNAGNYNKTKKMVLIK